MKVLFTGDFYLNPNKTYKKIDIGNNFSERISQSDYICVNLEGPLIDEQCRINVKKKGPCIYQDLERVKEFVEKIIPHSVLLCGLANNHIMDYGESGLRNTIDCLSQYRSNVRMAGAGDIEHAYRELMIGEGERMGILFAAEGGFGVIKDERDFGYAWFLHDRLQRTIKTIRKSCDYLVLELHAGLEEEVLPLPEIRKLYRYYIDNGTDIIIAHHPHVIQGREIYKGKSIYYSLGNFMFDSLNGNGEYNCESICVELETNSAGELVAREYPLRYKDGVIDVIGDGIIKFNEAQSCLDDYDYLDQINQICLQHFMEEYKSYFAFVHGHISPKKNLLLSIKEVFGKKELFDYNWLYHNLEIETHRWTALRGLEEYRRN